MSETLRKVRNEGVSDSVVKLLKKFLKLLDEYEVSVKNESSHWKEVDDRTIWATREVKVTYSKGSVVLYDFL